MNSFNGNEELLAFVAKPSSAGLRARREYNSEQGSSVGVCCESMPPLTKSDVYLGVGWFITCLLVVFIGFYFDED